jgi:drug/metabolite transporter (DMT)-like permease
MSVRVSTAAATTVVLWASSFVGVRATAHDLSAGSQSLGRLAVGGLVLGCIVVLRREPLPASRDFARIITCGVLWFGIYNLTLSQAVHHIDAGTASMLVNLAPLMIALLGGILLDEGFPKTLFIGCGIAFLGTFIIMFASSGGAELTAFSVGLCLTAAICYASAVVIQKSLLSRVSALQTTWLGCVAGMVVCTPFAPVLFNEIGNSSPATLTWLVYLGVGPTAVAFTTWAYALARSRAGRLAAASYLVPPVVILFGWFFLGEVPASLALAGGVLCLAGTALAGYRRRCPYGVSPDPDELARDGP